MYKIALTERSKQLIKNYIAGGAALGGSAALASSLVNYIKMLKEDQEPKTPDDDDTLYVNLPTNKVATAAPASNKPGATDLLAGGLAVSGGALSVLGSYALVRKMYQQMKKKQLQEQLDSAQQTFLTSAEEEAQQYADKNAAANPSGTPMGLGELLTSAPVAFTLLSALAGGALTNVALDKTFPSIKKKEGLDPKKVILRRPKVEGGEENEEQEFINEKYQDGIQPDQEKLASAEDYEDALEFLVGIAINHKSASNNVSDLIHAVATGRKNEFINNMMEHGLDTALETVKGASLNNISIVDKRLAIGLCVKSAVLQPVLGIMAAAEYCDMAPKFTYMSALQSDNTRNALVKIAAALGRITRQENLAVLDNVLDIEVNKSASAMGLEEILQLINNMKAERDNQGDMDGLGFSSGDVEEGEGEMNAEDSIVSGEEKEVNDLHPTKTNKLAPELIGDMAEDDDLIDNAMSKTTVPAQTVASEL